MRIVRFFGWIFALLALASLIHDGWALSQGRPLRFSAIGELWFTYAGGSLNFTQAIVQRYLAPEIWDDFVRPVLLWPALPVFAAIAFVLLLIGKRRRRR